LCATDKRAARDGRVVEELGHYDPEAKNENKVKIDRDRVRYWLSAGARPSPTVEQLLRHIGLDRKGNEVQPRPWPRKRKARKKPADEKAAGEAKPQKA
jgi:small subunit ribosomal protein S16